MTSSSEGLRLGAHWLAKPKDELQPPPSKITPSTAKNYSTEGQASGNPPGSAWSSALRDAFGDPSGAKCSRTPPGSLRNQASEIPLDPSGMPRGTLWALSGAFSEHSPEPFGALFRFPSGTPLKHPPVGALV
ncbi:hypothetical protein GUJ93_ZPchr0005g15398 [Zizania palustris]|uniref:Uncharacterized protein n=1 Tax=Zizania palustris TaxID=103762 RepID=A0A8J5SML9_ZIZPA|nr:hypothetical protein GUJ93_ZPchr0005g15398 [Zizania palustris]